MAKAVQTSAWDQTSIIWATIANANRDEKKQPEPFNPADIHPFRSKADFKSKSSGEPDWVTINKIRKQYKRTVLHGNDDQSRGSIS